MSDLKLSAGLMNASSGPISGWLDTQYGVPPYAYTEGWKTTSADRAIIVYKGAKPAKSAIQWLSGNALTYNSANVLIKFICATGIPNFAAFNTTTKKLSTMPINATAIASGTATHFIVFPQYKASIDISSFDIPMIICGDVGLVGQTVDLKINSTSLDIVSGQLYTASVDLVIPYDYTY